MLRIGLGWVPDAVWLCVLWVSGWKHPGTPPYLLPAGQQPQGKQGEKNQAMPSTYISQKY